MYNYKKLIIIISKLCFSMRNTNMFRQNISRLIKTSNIYGTYSQSRNFFTIVPQYVTGLRFGFGRYLETVEPGIRLNIPFYHDIVRIDMRERTVSLPDQEIISKDNVSCFVDAAIQYLVTDPKKAFLEVENFKENVLTRAELITRETLGAWTINDMLHKKKELGNELKNQLNCLNDDWGIDVKYFQIKKIVFDESMKRSMSKVAEAERTASAKIINANADVETAKKYAEAAELHNDASMRLREFQLLQSIAREQGNTTIVVPTHVFDHKMVVPSVLAGTQNVNNVSDVVLNA